MDGNYQRCADCNTEHQWNHLYRIVPPSGVESKVIFLCRACWDKMVGAAVMSIMRGM